MKKVITVNIILLIALFTAVTTYASSLSTSHTIRICLRVVSNPQIEGSGETVDMVSDDESMILEAPSDPTPPGRISKVPQDQKSNPFLKVTRAIRDIFSSFDKTQGMQRKY